jgi:hypothetical protein
LERQHDRELDVEHEYKDLEGTSGWRRKASQREDMAK